MAPSGVGVPTDLGPRVKRADKSEEKTAVAQAAEAATSSEGTTDGGGDTIMAAPRGRCRGQGKGNQNKHDSDKGKGRGKSQFQEYSKWKLFGTLVMRLTSIILFQDQDIRDLMGPSDILVYVLGESHPMALVLRNRYQDYMEDINKLKEVAKTEKEVAVSYPPQAMLFPAFIGKMIEDKEEVTLTDAMVLELNKWRDLAMDASDEQMPDICPIIPCTRAFAAKDALQKSKLRFMIKGSSKPLKSAINMSLCREGGVKKAGIAPRSGSVRDFQNLLDLFHNCEGEVWQ